MVSNMSVSADLGLHNDTNNTVVYTNSNGTVGYYDPNKDECTLLARLIINTVIAGIVCFLGFVGNAISYAVLQKDKQTPVASFLLQTLAMVDSFFLGLWFIHFSVNDIFEYARLDQYSYKYWMYVRLYSYPFLFIGQTATLWLTVLIALTRFIAICIPYRASQLCNLCMVKKYAGCVIAVSFIYNLPRFLDTKIVHVHKVTDKYYFSLAALGESKMYQLLYVDISYYIFTFVLPLLILAVLNTKLTLAYRRVQQRRRQLRGRSDNDSTTHSHHSDPNITLVMIIVVLWFMLCNLPARIVQIVWKYRDQKCLSPQFFIKEFSNVLEVLNSSTNFIIYCVFRKQFRDILWNQVCCAGIQNPSNGHINNNGTQNTTANGYTLVNKEPKPEPIKTNNDEEKNKPELAVSNGQSHTEI